MPTSSGSTGSSEGAPDGLSGQHCCGAPLQVFALAGPDRPEPTLALHRCGACGARAYVRAGVVVPRDEAFAQLAGTFRKTAPAPRTEQPAPVPRRGSVVSAAGAAQPVGDASSASAPPAPTRPITSTTSTTSTTSAGPVTDELVDLLAGWTVLGSRT